MGVWALSAVYRVVAGGPGAGPGPSPASAPPGTTSFPDRSGFPLVSLSPVPGTRNIEVRRHEEYHYARLCHYRGGGVMTEGEYERFASRAAEYGVDLTRATAEEATAAIADAIEAPAVGAPLGIDGVELPPDVTPDPTPADLAAADTGVTGAALAIADYGSLLLRADEAASEPVSLFVDRHVAVLRAEDVVPDMAAAFEWLGRELRETRDSAIIATGPSATADMGALVRGAHGPETVEVVVVG